MTPTLFFLCIVFWSVNCGSQLLTSTQWQTSRRRKKPRSLQLPRREYVASTAPSLKHITYRDPVRTNSFLSSSNSRNKRRKVRKGVRRRKKRIPQQPRKNQLKHQEPRSPNRQKMLNSKKIGLFQITRMRRPRKRMSQLRFRQSPYTSASPP